MTTTKHEPLAARMRPRTLGEVAGQEHLIGEGKPLSRIILADMLESIILYGPPGTGKTTLASVIAGTTQSPFHRLNATTAGKKDIEAVIKEAKKDGKAHILFIDEIHRFNKLQQDTLLPEVESGTVILIGATTENPYFEVNKALISRSRIFELRPLETDSIKKLLKTALSDPDRGFGNTPIDIPENALDFLAEISGGDARNALNSLELSIRSTPAETDGTIRITLADVENCVQKRAIRFDKDGDSHYDTISAFIKSMRGSDPDAALYYLALLLESGEDVKFIARRILVHAAEDVGLADPLCLCVASAAAQAVQFVGMPEARIILAEAVLHIATAPKSNSCAMSVDRACALAKTCPAQIPAHLQDAHYKGAKNLGHGTGYLYPHDFPGHYVEQQYLPDSLERTKIYEPGIYGREREWQPGKWETLHRDDTHIPAAETYANKKPDAACEPQKQLQAGTQNMPPSPFGQL